MNSSEKPASGPVPVHVLTGFLGSGKTTLINRLLASGAGEGLAIIVNEFGEIGLDSDFISSTDEPKFDVTGGCICCAGRQKLLDAIDKALCVSARRILIETTGLAMPGPVMAALVERSRSDPRFFLQGITTLIDALEGEQALSAFAEARQQVELADRTAITKLELVDEDQRPAIVERISSIATALNSQLQLVKTARLETDFWEMESPLHDRAVASGQVPHRSGLISVALSHEKSVSQRRVLGFLETLLSLHPGSIVRVKGTVRIEEDGKRYAIQGVGHRLAQLSALPDHSGTGLQLVVFLRDVPRRRIEDLFTAYFRGPAPDIPDEAALSANPLAVSGWKFS